VVVLLRHGVLTSLVNYPKTTVPFWQPRQAAVFFPCAAGACLLLFPICTYSATGGTTYLHCVSAWLLHSGRRRAVYLFEGVKRSTCFRLVRLPYSTPCENRLCSACAPPLMSSVFTCLHVVGRRSMCRCPCGSACKSSYIHATTSLPRVGGVYVGMHLSSDVTCECFSRTFQCFLRPQYIR